MGKPEITLENFKLWWEELPDKMKKTTNKPAKKIIKKNKIDVKAYLLPRYKRVEKSFRDVVNKITHPSKTVKKTTKKSQELAKAEHKRVILGIGLLLVVASIIYSTYVIFIGVDSSASRLALLPQALFATITLVKAFSKLYK